jgi:hypothetical protein
MQMMGRAVCIMLLYSGFDLIWLLTRQQGRPQFGLLYILYTRKPLLKCTTDTEGVAIIMCESELENKYRNLIQGRTVVESSLHQNLSEHLNSEIGLGTISDLTSAKYVISFAMSRIAHFIP